MIVHSQLQIELLVLLTRKKKKEKKKKDTKKTEFKTETVWPPNK